MERKMVENDFIYTEDPYLYIRGFLIIKADKPQPQCIHKSWKSLIFGNMEQYKLYFDPRNNVQYLKSKFYEDSEESWVLLLGTFMNTETSQMDLNKIAHDMLNALRKSENNFFEYVDVLGGRHIIVFSKNGQNPSLLTDATGMRSTFYKENDTIIASHYNLVNDIAHMEEHPFWQIYTAYKKTNYECVALPGNLTPYKDIKLLIPNHLITLERSRSKRFFPRSRFDIADVDSACDYIAENIRNQYEELVKHYDVIHSLTAGRDSRICLSAARRVKDQITTFTYHPEKPDLLRFEHRDWELNYEIAKEITSREGIKHIELFFRGPYPKSLMDIMDKNHYHPVNRIIEEARSKIHFTERTLHVRSSIVEICRKITYFYPYYRPINEKFALWSKYKDRSILNKAIPYFEQFYYENETESFIRAGAPLNVMHYWENRLPAWLGASVLVDNDILCDTYLLFNVRKILTFGLSIPEYWRMHDTIYYEILNRLWPSLLQYRMPNDGRQIYALLDRENTGYTSFKEVKTNSGSIYNKKREVKAYYEIRDYGACFGFSSNDLNKGDYCELIFKHNIVKGRSYYYEFNLLTIYHHFTPPPPI